MTRRLLVSYISITVIVLLVLEIPLALLFARSERRNLVAELKHDALALAIAAEETLEGDAADDLQAVAASYQQDTGARVVIVNTAGDMVADSDPPVSGERNFASRVEFTEALAGRESTGSRFSDTLNHELLYVAVPVASQGQVLGAVRITYPPTLVEAQIRRSWLVLGLVGVGVLAVVALVSLVLARSVARPLRDLESAARTLAEGRLDTRAPVPQDPEEIRTLATSFNAMATRLEHLVDAQRAFVADASHQLRTPLAALRLRLENLEAESPPEVGEDARAALAEVGRLSRLVDGLLALARAEAGAASPQPVDAAAVSRAHVDAWSAAASERGLTLRCEAPDEAIVRATPGNLEQVLDNLVSNALAAAPENSTVTVAVRPGRSATAVHVIDEGPGMTADERDRAFARFWRPASARPGGSGLGLAIVHRLVTADGGTVTLRGGPDGGLDAVVLLPTARQRPSGRTRRRAGTTP